MPRGFTARHAAGTTELPLMDMLPEHPEIRIDTTKLSAEEAADLVVAHLRGAGVTGPA